MNIKSRFSNKSIVGLIIIGIAFIGGGGLFWGLRASANVDARPEPIIRPVKVVSLFEATLKENRSFPGLVSAAQETKLAFRVSGPLIDFDARIGQQVEKGEVIARVDPRDFEINLLRLSAAMGEAKANLKAMKSGARAEDLARLKAEISSAKAQLTNTRKDLERQGNLLAIRAVSQAQFDGTKAAHDMAQANVEALSQELKKAQSGARSEDIEAAQAGIRRLSADIAAAENALADTELKAPFSGIVSQRYVENFENISAGKPVISFLDLANVEVHTAIPEDLIIRRAHLTEFYCVLDAYPGRRFEATLKEIGRKTDSANQSYPLTVILNVTQGLVVEPGMAATLHAVLENPLEPDSGFILPASAIFADAGSAPCVWRVDMQTMRVIKTPVVTGKLQQNTIQVISGLKAEDRVVIAGTRFLRDDQEIRILGETLN